MRRIVSALLLSTALGLVAAPVLAQSADTRALYDRIDRLEREISTLYQQVSRGGAAPGGPTVIRSPALGGGASESSAMPVGAYDRLDQLEDQVRQLTGKVEEANHRSAMVTKQLERMQADIDLRFKDLQAAGTQPQAQSSHAPQPQLSMPAPGATQPNGAPTLIPPKGVNVGGNSSEGTGPAPGPQTLGVMPEKDLKGATAKTQPAPQPEKPKDAQGLYDDAYQAAQRGDYGGAEAGFQRFLQQHPTHQLAGNASYWLGDIAYSRKDFTNSAILFADAYKKFPKHTKAPDMLYKLGASFGQLGKTKEACKAFHLLLSEHPDMPERLKRATTSDRQKLGCS